MDVAARRRHDSEDRRSQLRNGIHVRIKSVLVHIAHTPIHQCRCV